MADFKAEDDPFGAADYDRLTCEFLYDRYRQVAPVVCYHAQQFAEKLLKAVYASEGLPVAKTHDLLGLSTKLEDLGLLSFSDEAWCACAFLNQCEASIRYVTFTDAQCGEALEALANANKIATEIGENGYPTMQIDVPARFMRDEMERYGITERAPEAREDLDEMASAKASEADLLSGTDSREPDIGTER